MINFQAMMLCYMEENMKGGSVSNVPEPLFFIGGTGHRVGR